jgi:HD-like signal output (HDOD) protein
MSASDSKPVPYELDVRFGALVRDNKVRVPAYPAAANRLTQIISRDDYGLSDLAQVIRADQALAAAVLRQANSAALSPPAPVTSLDVAVGRIGTQGLVRLAFTVGIGAELCRPGPMFALRRMVWRHALLAAELCRQLAPARRLAPDEAFVCGLLHDFGKAVGLACIEQIVAESKSSARLSTQRCLEVIEAYHVRLGAMLAKSWRLPPLVCAVIAGHHPGAEAGAGDESDAGGPAAAGPTLPAMLDIVMAADAIVMLLDEGPAVAEARLVGVPQLSPDERRVVARCLADVPGVVQEFEPSAFTGAPLSPPRERAPVLERPTTALAGELYPVSFKVKCPSNTARPVDYQATYLTRAGFGMRGRVPLPEQFVVRVRLECDPAPFDLWGTVKLCSADGPGFRIEVQPIALRDLALAQWEALLARAEAGQARSRG